MHRLREWVHAFVIVGGVVAFVDFAGCTLTVDTSPLSNHRCASDKKECPVQGQSACVSLDDPLYGCRRAECESCGSLGFRHVREASCHPVSGACAVASCESGWRHCPGKPESGGCETSLLTDNENCSACGTACPTTTTNATPTCLNGACTAVCFTGYGDCDGKYPNGCEVDLRSDPAHCGSCTAPPCAAPKVCTMGECL